MSEVPLYTRVGVDNCCSHIREPGCLVIVDMESSCLFNWKRPLIIYIRDL